jgi:meso-butanediol dehydrogenase/(S,S)-butanediol dehydrogenase/diacetyl reductase
MSSPDAFAGRIALVTGATSGIGAACAREFARCGAGLSLSGRDETRGATLCDELAALGAEVEFIGGDLRDRSFCKRVVDQTLERFECLDVLVNSAGIAITASGLATTDEQWDATLETNLSAAFFVSRAALPSMCERGRGAIVNVASDWGIVGGERAAAYCASKGGLVLLTKAMALDHATDGVRINAVCPTDTDTPMLDDEFRQRGLSTSEGHSEAAAGIPMGRIATAAEVAQAVCFLASDEAAFITGVALPIDGGTTAR